MAARIVSSINPFAYFGNSRLVCSKLPLPAAREDLMERFTISLDESLAGQFDELISARGYSNRSEAVRDLIRGAIESDRQRAAPTGHCVANLSYVYNHHTRELAERLTAIQHDHHDLTVAAMHVHLDHENCLETVILKGRTETVVRFAQRLMAESGVRHGQFNVISV